MLADRQRSQAGSGEQPSRWCEVASEGASQPRGNAVYQVKGVQQQPGHRCPERGGVAWWKYTTFVSRGYFPGAGEPPTVGMFAVLVALTGTALVVVLT
jgi:hypothetical protein